MFPGKFVFDLILRNHGAVRSQEKRPRDDIVERIKENLGVGGDTIDELMSHAIAADPAVIDEVHDSSELTELALTASVVRLVNELLTEALQQNASDLHIEPQERGLTIRYRLHGGARDRVHDGPILFESVFRR